MLSNISVQKQILRYVVPFTVKDAYELKIKDSKEDDGKLGKKQANSEEQQEKKVFPYEHIVEKIDAQRQIVNGNSQSVWQRTTISDDNSESDLYKYVRDEFKFDDADGAVAPNKSGVSWKYAIKSNNSIAKLRYYEKEFGDHYYELNISDMGLYLFDNGILFIWYEISLHKNTKMSAEELVAMQYSIKELNRTTPILWQPVKEENGWGYALERQNENAPAYRKPVILGDFINDKIAFLNPIYFAERKSAFSSMVKMMEKNAAKNGIEFKSPDQLINAEKQRAALLPDKALLFSYVVADEKLEDDETLAFYLANGYKESYKLSDTTRGVMVHPFENVTWYATKEGCAYLAKIDELNDNFFTSTMLSKITGDYFSLYIKALFQSYSLLLYAQKIQKEISTDYVQYLYVPIDEEITHLYAEINLFLTNSMATSVSHIHQQSEFFCYLKDQLRIHDDIKSITSGIEAIDSLQREERLRTEEEQRRKEEEKESKRDRKMQSALNVLAFLGVFSALVDCFDLIGKFDCDEGEFWKLLIGFKVMEIVAIIIILGVSIYIIGSTILGKKEDEE